jgi:hypothetical protein
MKNFRKYFGIFVLITVLIFTGIQSTYAQMKVLVTFTPCPDNCTTQENCKYRANYTIIDKCGEKDSVLCSPDYEEIACEDYLNGIQIECGDCSGATYNPCLLVIIVLQKICIGPNGSHVVCQATKQEYHTCEELLGNQPITFYSWD